MIYVRRAIPEDADALTAIALAAKRHWGYPERWIEIWTPQLTFTPDYFETNEGWVAEMDRHPVGFYTLLASNDVISLENLWVTPEFIGKGIGKMLFLHATELARLHGYKTLQLDADPNAMGFYERMGMRKVGERRADVAGQSRVLPIMEISL